MSNDLLLIVIAGATSMLTAVTSIGGGMMLIVIMPGFLPAAAIVPVHALVQLFSNSSLHFSPFGELAGISTDPAARS